MEEMQIKRPGYHYATPTDWLNDPNGMVWHNGQYHLFYQWCPGIVIDGSTMHWGHAVSKDLVNWQHLGRALAPGKLGAIWSGSCVVDQANTSGLFDSRGGMVAVYTYRSPDDVQQQGIAFSSDGMNWTEYEGNPVLSFGPNNKDFRDPKVFWHGQSGRWIMIVGVPLRLFWSANLREWHLLDTIGSRSECPDMFPLAVEGEGRSAWVISHGGREYRVGSFDGERFTAQGPIRSVDGGMDFYAAQSWDNVPDGRRPWLA